MNKKQLNKIISLHKAGVSTRACIQMIIDISLEAAVDTNPPIDTVKMATYIDDFYVEVGV